MNIARTIFPLFVGALIFISCFNDNLNPVAPTWDIDLTVPVINHPYSMMDLAKKQPGLLTVGSGNQLVYHTSVVAPPDSVGNNLSLNPAPQQRSIKVGAFSLNDVALSGGFFFPFLPPRATLPAIPDTIVAAPDLQNTITDFTSATLRNGTATLAFTNNLSDTVSLVSDLMLADNVAQFATFAFAGVILAPNSTVTRTASLAGQIIRSSVTLSGVAFHFYKKTTQTVIPDTLIKGAISMTGMRATSASLAYIPAQQLTNNDTTYLSLNDSTIVKYAVLGSGQLFLDFSSAVPLDMTITASFPEVLQGSAPSYTEYTNSVFYRSSLGTMRMQVPLAGLRIQSLNNNLIDSLMVVSSLRLPGSPNPINLHDTDKVNVVVNSDGNLRADSVIAVLRPTWININRSVPTNLGDFSKKFSGTIVIPTAGLKLNTLSTVGCPVDLYLQMVMINPTTHLPVVLPVPQAQRRIGHGAGSVVFDPTAVGTFLSSVSPKFPDSVSITGRVLVNPYDVYNPTISGVDTVARKSLVRDTVVLDIPFHLSVTGGVFRDTASLSIDTKQVNKMNSGTVHFELQNGLPAHALAKVVLLDSLRVPVLTIPQAGQPLLDVTAAPVNGQGNVTGPVTSSIALTLSGSDIQKFNRAKYAALEMDINTTPGAPVVFRTTDSVQFRVYATLSYRVSK